MDERIRAVCGLMMPVAREMAGLHEYDGTVQDLSPDGVRRGLAALARARDRGGDGYTADHAEARGAADHGEARAHDAAHLAVFAEALRVRFGELELHRRDPYPHIANLELTTYDRQYAPEGERAVARRRHLAQWPDAVDAAIASLDRVSAPVARALLGAARGLAQGLDAAQGPTVAAALAAHARFVAHLERAAAVGDPDPRLGGPALARLMGSQEGLHVDLSELAGAAEHERERLTALLGEACQALDPGCPPERLVARLLADHPDTDGVIPAAAALADEVIAFSRERRLVPYLDGECRVGLAPASRRWSSAMLTWAAPGERDAVSWYYVTPPGTDWPSRRRAEWLTLFSHTVLPAVTVHEVAPGHFAHGRALRRATSDVRRSLHSLAFCEGWAHYAEEMCLEQGFRGGDPRYAIGVALEALLRVTRLSCAIGLHTGAMGVAEATERFARDAHLAPAAATAEARRGTFDATCGRYTWGKLELLRLRERARREWGPGFSLERFHRALLALGSPPLGLVDRALDQPGPPCR